VYYIQPGDNGPQIMIDAMKSQDRVVIWRDFIKDSGNILSKYQDDKYVYDNFDRDKEYGFLANYSHTQSIKLPLGEAMQRMNKTSDLYGSFMVNLAPDNPKFKEEIHESFRLHGEEFGNVLGDKNTIYASYMFYGNRFAFASHNALLPNWFLQIAGTKSWRLVPPEWTPYMKPMAACNPGIFLSGHAFLRNSSRVPRLDVRTRPGDLMFFPSNWWHEVHNVGPDEFQLAVAIRPRQPQKLLPWNWFLFPWTAPKGVLMNKFTLMAVAISKAVSHLDLKDRAKNAEKHAKMNELFPDYYRNKHHLPWDDILHRAHDKEDLEAWKGSLAEKLLKTEL
jgi:hypothetical protein